MTAPARPVVALVAVRCLLGLLVPLLAAAPLCAQGKPKPSKPKKGEPAAAQPATVPAVKDDALTAKDKAIVANDKFAQKHPPDRKRDGWRGSLTAPEQLPFDAEHDYQWHLLTNKGELTARLFVDVAPMHATNIVWLTRLGFYDGLTFHRVIKGFMAQGGCPLGNGTGSPGYFIAGECDARAKHDKPGVLSTANEEGKPKTDGSQFFVTFAPEPHLDGKHTVFGEVVVGLDVVQALDACGGDDSGKPTEKLAIERAWITVTAKAAADEPAKGEPTKGEPTKAQPKEPKKGG